MITICKNCKHFEPAELNMKAGYRKPERCKALQCEKKINFIYGYESCKEGTLPLCHEINTNGNCPYFKEK